MERWGGAEEKGSLLKIFELLSPSARIDPLPEHIIRHVQSVHSDLVLDPFDALERGTHSTPGPSSTATAATPRVAESAVGRGEGEERCGCERPGARAGGEGGEEEEEKDGRPE
ncbi:hypothetical protein SAY86_024227 [Trapa natans]|uniref:Uncharacterized protein n=1 Tax=Trapa natans TaxID=22666 RepID=A0AAN7MH47_TRANT|nr:hypothetical protein SAY86_024227 [Trapa natans]